MVGSGVSPADGVGPAVSTTAVTQFQTVFFSFSAIVLSIIKNKNNIKFFVF